MMQYILVICLFTWAGNKCTPADTFTTRESCEVAAKHFDGEEKRSAYCSEEKEP